ncbi:MAG TPA: MerR family transcriptional regulator [Methylomirabilota bacterium]|jgi:DNA-binding transcriptional MerR regulator
MKSSATLASQPLTIGKLAGRSGFTVKALRYYDRRGLLPPSGRRPSGYRLYLEADMHRLRFIRQAKALGLTLEAIRELMAAAGEHGGASTRRRLLRMLDERIAQTTAQIGALIRLRRELHRRRSALQSRRPRRDGGGYCTCLHETT